MDGSSLCFRCLLQIMYLFSLIILTFMMFLYVNNSDLSVKVKPI